MSDKEFEDSEGASAFAVPVYQNPAPAALVVELDNAEPVQCAERVKNEGNQAKKIDIISESVDVIFDYVFKIRSESHEMYKDMLEKLNDIEETRANNSELVNERLDALRKAIGKTVSKSDYDNLKDEITMVRKSMERKLDAHEEERSNFQSEISSRFSGMEKTLNQILKKIR